MIASPAGVRATVLLATVAWAAGEALMRRSPAVDHSARAVWTIGLALMILHVVLAFEVVYAWNHAAAVAATARQTAAVVGRGWEAGIFVNYVFIAVWAADVCWWWTAPASRASRSRRLETARFAFFVFMFVNGAIVFASGVGRVVGVVAVAGALATGMRRR